LVAAGGSGHGFMFGPAMAEQLSKWMTGSSMDIDLTPLAPGRFKERRSCCGTCSGWMNETHLTQSIGYV